MIVCERAIRCFWPTCMYGSAYYQVSAKRGVGEEATAISISHSCVQKGWRQMCAVYTIRVLMY